MDSANERPLITFALIGYNQERYIEPAIDGALSQTYAPLEVILSDDGSSDSTFDIMRHTADHYSGCHRLIVNRNDQNLGIARHINRVFALAHGSLIVIAAGDDISLPNRVQLNYEAWELSQRKALCIYSGHNIIGADGQQLANTGLEYPWSNDGGSALEAYSVTDFFGQRKIPICGATAAWSPRLMEVFGPLPSTIVHEDEVLALRATCLGPFVRLAYPLVEYRTHDNNSTSYFKRSAQSSDELDRLEFTHRRLLEGRIEMHVAFERDLKTAREQCLISESSCEHAVHVCRKQHSLLQDELELLTSSFVRKCHLLWRLKRQGMPTARLRSLFYRLLPTRSYRAVKLWRQRYVSNRQPSHA